MQPFEIIGHRGAAGLAPENTLPSFERAWAEGCRWVELDVHTITGSQDTLAVIHDATLDRTTNRKGAVSALTREALTDVNAGGGMPIPTLAEVYQRLREHAGALLPGRYGINVELKGDGTAGPVAHFLAAQAQPGDVATLVSSFDHAALFEFRRHDAVTPVAPLLARWRNDIEETAAALGARTINLSRRCATPQRIAQLRAAGYEVLVYTVNDLATARGLKDAGARGVFSDYPDRLQSLAAGALT